MLRAMTRRSLVLLAALACAAVAASPGATKPKDACGLLTKAEVIAAIGEPLASTQGGSSATGAIYCNWTGKDSHLFSKGIALIAATDNVAARYASYAGMLKSKKPVVGVGTAAVTDGNVILARSGKAMVQIGPMYVNSGISAAKIKALAKKALARA
jgi:hypothetical protein